MKQTLSQLRFYLEIISVPIFAWLVIHLSGHALMLLGEGDHDHEAHAEVSSVLSLETLLGLAALIVFVWIWHRPIMAKLVPCAHEHCHHQSIWPHLAATAAFVFHFLPESEVRYEIMQSFSWDSVASIAGLIGFASHFLVDAIVALLLVSFWPKTWQKATLMTVITSAWIVAFGFGSKGGFHLEGLAEPVLLLISAFFLTMFVHKPHRPQQCTTC